MTETQNQQPKTYKKLYRNSDNVMLKGLLGGLGEYFNTDPTLLRLLFTFFVVFTAIVPGTIVYFVASWIVPKKHEGKKVV
jgi:phage shock protein C